ncbi:MAG: LCP family protein [Clostridiales bacterium]|nr:LCP family protein [Clostridiales bacterium]
MKRRRKKAKKSFISKKQAAVFGISLAVLLTAFVIAVGLSGLFPGTDEDEEFVEPVSRETGVINILVAGLDKSESLTDTIMVASYDLDNDKINILSVPRDTRMYIGSRYQKINAAYSISKNGKKNGIKGTIEAVTRLTGIPINYYIEFTCSAFRETIDALGGVDFEVPQNMNYDDPTQDLHIHLTKGFQHLDGDKAEQLVRFRRYPMGDIDRVSVQQSFLKAVAEQKINASIISKIPDLYKVLTKEVKTNFTLSEVSRYAINVQDLTSENISMYSLPGTANGTDYGSSYWIPNMTELASLIEGTFGYDASNITIHSADGTSVSKDVKKTSTKTEKKESATEKPKATEKPNTTQKPEETEKPKTTEKPKATASPSPSATVKPTETEQPHATKAPEEEKPAEETPKNTDRQEADPTEE